MGRLIDADRLKAHYAWWGEDSDKRRTFDCIVDVQPSVDAAQIKHGRWVEFDHRFVRGEGIQALRCSECGGGTHYKPDPVEDKYLFCYSCGAMMDA